MSIDFFPIQGFDAYLIKSTQQKDSRGSMQRIWESMENLPDFEIKGVSWVSNPKKYTLRGLHFQLGEFAETKLVFCTSGSVFDVGVDLRRESSTYLNHFGFEIGPDHEFQGILLPKGFAHGYLTLSRNSNLVYLMDRPYSPKDSSGINWSDKSLGIRWPKKPKVMSVKDGSWPII